MTKKLTINAGNPPTLKPGDAWDDETGRKMFDGEKVVSVPTAEQVAAYRAQEQAAEQKAQEACVTELIKVAESHGYIIAAIPQPVQSALPGIITIGAQWGLQRKQ